MSTVDDFQKVVKAYQALGKDDFLVGEKMVAEFFEELTGLEDFLDQGPRESDEHYLQRIKEVISEVAPLINKIPENLLAPLALPILKHVSSSMNFQSQRFLYWQSVTTF